jgi:hypothetical protein
MAEKIFIESETLEGTKRDWYELNGTDSGTGVEFNHEVFALCADGTILDCDGCPLECESDYQTIAVRNTL